MVELFVAVRAKRFKLRKVTVKKGLAVALFAEPNHFEVHVFSMRQNCIISFIKTGGVKLTDKDRSIRVFF
jgi:hypothetical protein